MKNLLIIFLSLTTTLLWAHTGIEHEKTTLKTWQIDAENKTVEASFLMLKDKVVFLEDKQQAVIKYPLSALALKDQMYALQKFKQIEQLNTTPSVSKAINWVSVLNQNFWLCVWFVSLLAAFLFMRLRQNKFTFQYAHYGVLAGIMLVFLSFIPKPILGTDPLFIDSAFTPFKSKVKTHWDSQYFYVEDLGLPSHPMMKGITAWQQQVPIIQCYTGSNAWSIPLNPVIATTPVPTASNFFKGAVALAANGIPIFNALNNRGEDSYLIGELDQYGGHCGRADDYHYHIAPLSLDSINADVLPIAFALDGFAVYASKEPNGTTMQTLDANHGHYLNGVYHYHGTTNYPYLVGNMVGVVTKDATDQIIPQAQSKPVRPAGTPLNGAVITNHQSTGTNAYSLTYTLSNQSYTVTYSWTNAGAFTFNWGSPTGTTTTNYNATICTLSTATDELLSSDRHVKIYPNPAKTGFSLDLSSPFNTTDIKDISIFDAKGSLIFKTNQYKFFIEIPKITEGVYFVKIQFPNSQLTKKLTIQ